MRCFRVGIDLRKRVALNLGNSSLADVQEQDARVPFVLSLLPILSEPRVDPNSLCGLNSELDPFDFAQCQVLTEGFFSRSAPNQTGSDLPREDEACQSDRCPNTPERTANQPREVGLSQAEDNPEQASSDRRKESQTAASVPTGSRRRVEVLALLLFQRSTLDWRQQTLGLGWVARL